MEPVILKFMETANLLTASNLEVLDSIYAPEIRFADPATEVRGLPEVKRYFAAMYAGLLESRFDFHGAVETPGAASLEWTMTFRHRALAGGKPKRVRGCSILRHGNLIESHRDYFDLGEMLYENVPLLGWGCRLIKRRLEGANHGPV